MVSYAAILCNIMQCFSHKEEERSNVWQHKEQLVVDYSEKGLPFELEISLFTLSSYVHVRSIIHLRSLQSDTLISQSQRVICSSDTSFVTQTLTLKLKFAPAINCKNL